MSNEMTINEARSKLGDLVIRTMAGERVTLTRYGKPAAVLVDLGSAAKLRQWERRCEEECGKGGLVDGRWLTLGCGTCARCKAAEHLARDAAGGYDDHRDPMDSGPCERCGGDVGTTIRGECDRCEEDERRRVEKS